MNGVKDKVKEVVGRFLESEGFDLIDLDMQKRSNSFTVQVLTDKPTGGIIVDECVKLNRKIREMLEDENLITDDCALEVASPGIDRDICTKKDFQRIQGKEILVYLKESLDEKDEYQGILQEVLEDTILILKDNNKIVLPLANINKAKQII